MKTITSRSIPRRLPVDAGCWIGLVLASAALAGCGRDGASPSDALHVSGNIEVIDAELSFKVPGRLRERLVDEGDTVAAGAPVARLDATELEQQRDARRAELAVAQAALAELEAGARPAEVAASEAVLRSAEAERERARLEFRRQEELRATDAVSAREFEGAQTQLRVAEARVAEAAKRLELLREGARAETIAQARARVQQAAAALALADTQVANARLDAPFAGVVIEKHAEPGEFLATGAPVVTVADLRHVWLRAYVNETDLGRIRLGQAVDVRTDSYPDRTYRGRLSFISSAAEFTPKSVQTEKERVTLVFRVKIDLDNSAGELKPGMAADASLPLQATE